MALISLNHLKLESLFYSFYQSLCPPQLGYINWNIKIVAWEIEPGAYDLCISTSCEDLPLLETVIFVTFFIPNN